MTTLTLHAPSSRITTRLYVILTSGLLLFINGTPSLRAQSAAAPAPAAIPTEHVKSKGRLARLIDPMGLTDEAKLQRVQGMASTWLTALEDWHKQHDSELASLWSQWAKARAVVPKDDFPGEVVAHKIEDVYSSLKPAYEAFIKQLEAEVTSEQINAIKEKWSFSPGMERTYNAYLEIAPDLTDEQKKVIRDRMYMAREASMLSTSDKEIVNIFKTHKAKVEEYIGSLEWAKLHRAFANKGKPVESAP